MSDNVLRVKLRLSDQGRIDLCSEGGRGLLYQRLVASARLNLPVGVASFLGWSPRKMKRW